MPSYISCLMDGYGVLPGSPVRLRVTNIDVNFAIVHWEAPKYHGDTVVNYNLYYRPMYKNQEYSVIMDVRYI